MDYLALVGGDAVIIGCKRNKVALGILIIRTAGFGIYLLANGLRYREWVIEGIMFVDHGGY